MPEEYGSVSNLDSIAIIGGGRWARVLTEVVCKLVAATTKVSVHSLHNADSMLMWVKARGFEERISVSSESPDFVPNTSNAIIVVNAARDHETAVRWALSAGVPVLAEKPVTLTAAATGRLVELAADLNIPFAAAHVFLFARYIDRFAKFVADAGRIQSLRVHWADPQAESRYGEQKQYDASISVISDCLPHVLSIIGTLTPELPHGFKVTKFQRGGASLELELMFGDISCTICLERNSDQRRRHIAATVGQRVLQLDFAREPGLISDGTMTVSGDPDWETQKRPVACMLTAFLGWASNNGFDSRLDVETGLRSCQVIDRIMDEYRLEMKSWLSAKFSSAGPFDDDLLHYALHEILQSEGPLSKELLEQQTEQIVKQVSERGGADLLESLTKRLLSSGSCTATDKQQAESVDKDNV